MIVVSAAGDSAALGLFRVGCEAAEAAAARALVLHGAAVVH
jgi:hypothetical protein